MKSAILSLLSGAAAGGLRSLSHGDASLPMCRSEAKADVHACAIRTADQPMAISSMWINKVGSDIQMNNEKYFNQNANYTMNSYEFFKKAAEEIGQLMNDNAEVHTSGADGSQCNEMPVHYCCWAEVKENYVTGTSADAACNFSSDYKPLVDCTPGISWHNPNAPGVYCGTGDGLLP